MVVQHSKLGSVLEADLHQKLSLRFTVLDKQTKKPMRCHQAFVRLEHKQTGKEAIFLAEPDSALLYKFDMVSHLPTAGLRGMFRDGRSAGVR